MLSVNVLSSWKADATALAAELDRPPRDWRFQVTFKDAEGGGILSCCFQACTANRVGSYL